MGLVDLRRLLECQSLGECRRRLRLEQQGRRDRRQRPDGTSPANRAMAIANTAVYEAVNAITRRYPAGALKLEAAPGASVDAAIAAANRTALAKLLPSQQAAIDGAYQAALAKMARPRQGFGHCRGRAGRRRDPGVAGRGRRGCGGDVSTADHGRRLRADSDPAATQWPQRKPWLMTGPSQFRPGPPPALNSALWARDFNEVKALGGKSNSRRTAEQTRSPASGRPPCRRSTTGSSSRSPRPPVAK